MSVKVMGCSLATGLIYLTFSTTSVLALVTGGPLFTKEGEEAEI